MSGSSGTQLDQLEDVPVRVLEVPRPSAGNLLDGAERTGPVALDEGAHVLEGLHADAHDRPAPVVAAPLEGGRMEHGVQREVHAGPKLQLDPGRRSRPLRKANDLAPE